MQRLVHIPGEFEIWSTALTQPSDFRSPFAGEEFNLLLIAGHTDWDEEQRKWLARMLIGHNCRFVMAISPDAKSWDRRFDLTAIFDAEDGDADVLAAKAESVDQAVFMSLQVYGSGRAIRVLMLSIGHCPALTDQVVAAVVHEFADSSQRVANQWIATTMRQIRNAGGGAADP